MSNQMLSTFVLRIERSSIGVESPRSKYAQGQRHFVHIGHGHWRHDQRLYAYVKSTLAEISKYRRLGLT
jgi:hypothetical protein